MISISILIYLLVAVAVGAFVVSVLVSPLRSKYPIAAKCATVLLWTLLASAATWPVTMGPLIYKVSCSFFTKFIVEPSIDARDSGYLDTRFIIGQYDPDHNDGTPVRSGVTDLLAGRIAFFEAKIAAGAKTQSTHARYLRYSLVEAGSDNCKPHRLGYWTGIEAWNPMPDTPTKCLGVREEETALSRYQVSGKGFKGQEGTTAIVDLKTDQVVAIFRSFYNSGFLGVGGTYCPAPVGNGPHAIFSKLVFMDALGSVANARKR